MHKVTGYIEKDPEKLKYFSLPMVGGVGGEGIFSFTPTPALPHQGGGSLSLFDGYFPLGFRPKILFKGAKGIIEGPNCL